MTVATRLVADGGYTALNITTATSLAPVGTVNADNPAYGTVYRVIVVVTAAAASSIIDSTGTTATAANTILTIPASTTQGTVYTLNWPFKQGLGIVPGSGVTLAVSWSVGNQG